MIGLSIVSVFLLVTTLIFGTKMREYQKKWSASSGDYLGERERRVEGETREAALERRLASTRSTLLLLAPSVRYAVSVVDWGEEFTGTGDILPRWRWVVYDADLALWSALAGEYYDKSFRGSMVNPFMLGNSETESGALLDAYAWISGQPADPDVPIVFKTPGLTS